MKKITIFIGTLGKNYFNFTGNTSEEKMGEKTKNVQLIWDNESEMSQSASSEIDDINDELDYNGEEEEDYDDKVFFTKAEVEVIRKELKLESDREKRYLEREILKKKEQELKHLKEEKDDEIETLRKQVEDLKLSQERTRLLNCKRSINNDIKAKQLKRKEVINEICTKQGIARLECVLVVVKSSDLELHENENHTRSYYAFRRQLSSLIPILCQKLEKIGKFVCWFITDNAVQDFNQCKEVIREKFNELPESSNEKLVKAGRNIMEFKNLENEVAMDQMIIGIMENLYSLKADVEVLKQIFQQLLILKKAGPDANLLVQKLLENRQKLLENRSTDEENNLLLKIYRYVKIEFCNYVYRKQRGNKNTIQCNSN